MTRPIGDVRRRWLAVVLCLAVAAGTLGVPAGPPVAHAQVPDAGPPADDVEPDEEPDEGPPPPTPEELAHEAALAELTAALRDRRATEVALRAASTSAAHADGRLRAGEEVVVDDLLAQLAADEAVFEAEREVKAATARVGRSERRLAALRQRGVELQAEIEVARLQLEERVVRAYKTGSLAFETTLPLTLVREASTPSELATAIKHLSTLMAVGLDEVETLVDELAANAGASQEAAEDLEEAEAARSAAQEAAAEAAEARERSLVVVDEQEARVAAVRAAAYAAEGRVLAAVAAVARAQQTLAAAASEAEATAVAAASSVPDGGEVPEPLPPEVTAEEVDDAGASDEEDEQAGGWEGRASALTRARSLPAEDRRSDPSWVCPVEGSRFVNDWGFPRSNHRRHEGTDVFAPRGAPVLAPVDATVADLDAVDRYDGRRDLGGISVTLESGRHRYYLAHLDSIHPDLRAGDVIAAGSVVGWVGRTGNARGTPPHLHLGWYVDRVAVNPYGSLAVACSSERPLHRER